MIITPTDVKNAGLCASGCRRWFIANGFSRAEFRTFVREGLPAEVLMKRGDALARVVVDRTRRRLKDGRQ